MNQEQSQVLGQLLRQKRQELGYSTRQLSRAAGVTDSTVVRLEQGKFRAPRPDKLVRFAELLGLSPIDLFARVGYLLPSALPALDAYFLAKYAELPKAAVAELVEFVTDLLARYGLGERRLSADIQRFGQSAPTADELLHDASFQNAMAVASLPTRLFNQELHDDTAGAAA